MSQALAGFAAFITWFCLATALSAQWTNYAPQPTARWGHACCSYGGKIYSVSGYGWTNVEVYTPGTNTWATIAPIPVSVGYPAVSGWNGKIYVMGGATGSVWQSLNQIYDIATNTWSTGAPMPNPAMGVASVAYNGRIYVPGGWNSVYTNFMQIYDVAANTWSQGTLMPTARYEYGIGLIGDDIYVTGGNSSVSNYSINEAYDIPTNTWVTRAPMLAGRYIHAGASDGVSLHEAGGYPQTASYESYNPTTNTWTARPPLTVSRYRVAGAVANNCFYVIAGFNGSAPVANNEGFCNLVVLPLRPDIRLETTVQPRGVQLDWNIPVDLAGLTWQVERSLNGEDFEPFATVRAAPTALDRHMTTDRVWYRVWALDANGEQVQSNIAEALVDGRREAVFAYEAAEARLRFWPASDAPAQVALVAADGKVMREAQWSPRAAEPALEWHLEGLAPGVYVFVYAAGGERFARKVAVARP